MRRLFAIVRGCCLFLMLVATLLLVIMLTRVTPNLDSWWEFVRPYLADTAEEEVVYFDWEAYPYLPGDVELSDELKDLASLNGFEEYDIQALIAGAARYDIRWGDVLAIQMNTQWLGGFSDMFILALSIAKTLDELGYHDEPPPCPTPTVVPPEVTPEPGTGCVQIDPRIEAIRNLYPAGGEEWLQRVLNTSAAWEGVLHTATIVPIEPENLFDLTVIFTELLVYQIQQGPTDVLVYDANGNPIIIPNADSPVIPYPGEIEGFFADPFPGSWITGYHFGDPVYNDKGELIRAHHPGVDLGGIGTAAVFAAHDGDVIYAGWMSSSSLWISGYVVAVKSTYPDGTPVCTLYGHGENGSLRVGVGDTVSAGDQLMTADNTGYSFGNHLHLDLRFGEGNFCGQSVDPMRYIR